MQRSMIYEEKKSKQKHCKEEKRRTSIRFKVSVMKADLDINHYDTQCQRDPDAVAFFLRISLQISTKIFNTAMLNYLKLMENITIIYYYIISSVV